MVWSKKTDSMNPTFELWIVENPMTVIRSSHLEYETIWEQMASPDTELFIYTAWDYKTMNLNTIKITLSLN